jgi:hypothetical protein
MQPARSLARHTAEQPVITDATFDDAGFDDAAYGDAALDDADLEPAVDPYGDEYGVEDYDHDPAAETAPMDAPSQPTTPRENP